MWLAPLLAPLVAASAVAAPGVEAIETLGPGPFLVGRADWSFDAVPLTPVVGTLPLEVAHFGTAAYPGRAEGAGAPLAKGGPFPLVVFAHGRYQLAPYILHNHEQATYLIEHLASWGMIVVSVNLDVVGQYSNPPAILQRAEIIHETLAELLALDPNEVLFDRERIALIGHSRGGDAVITAWLDNPDGHPIAAVGTIAPTDFDDTWLGPVPYFGLYGSKDGDVGNGMPQRQYDNAAGPGKGLEYIHGANHFWFTDSIHYSGEGDALITREQHHDIARAAFAHFLRGVFGANDDPHFTELADGPSLFPLTDVIEMLPNFRHPHEFVLDDFEQWPIDPGTSTAGLPVTGGNLVVFDEENLVKPSKTFYHRTKAAWLAFDQAALPDGWYAQQVPEWVDAREYRYLSLRALQYLNGELNTPDAEQDFTVALVDADGDVGTARLSDHGKVVWPITHQGNAFKKKSVLRTTRIPLRAFFADNPALDMGAIRMVTLVFDQTPSGDLRVDDIVFTD